MAEDYGILTNIQLTEAIKLLSSNLDSLDKDNNKIPQEMEVEEIVNSFWQYFMIKKNPFQS